MYCHFTVVHSFVSNAENFMEWNYNNAICTYSTSTAAILQSYKHCCIWTIGAVIIVLCVCRRRHRNRHQYKIGHKIHSVIGRDESLLPIKLMDPQRKFVWHSRMPRNSNTVKAEKRKAKSVVRKQCHTSICLFSSFIPLFIFPFCKYHWVNGAQCVRRPGNGQPRATTVTILSVLVCKWNKSNQNWLVGRWRARSRFDWLFSYRCERLLAVRPTELFLTCIGPGGR